MARVVTGLGTSAHRTRGLRVLAIALAAALPSAPLLAQDVGEAGEVLPGHRLGGIALDHARRAHRAGLAEDDLAEMYVTSEYRSSHNGVTHVHLRQRLHGIDVVNASVNVNLDRNGVVSSIRGGPARELLRNFNAWRPELAAAAAIARALGALGLGALEPRVLEQAAGPEQRALYSGFPISSDDIPVRLVYYRVDSGELRLSWEIVIRPPGDRHWWQVWVDAVTGDLVESADWVANASYEVFDIPKESPHDGPRSVVVDPADPLASPLGWHDTDGLPGLEWTITRGNNAWVNSWGWSPEGGPTLDFRFALELQRESPLDYTDAATTNLFYWVNQAHDVLYHYGFDEASGNFQENNYGQAGLDGDPMIAYAQQSGHCRAYSAVPPDGKSPSIWIHTCSRAPYHHDGSFDNGVIVHEYCHGLSQRLTGGPQDSSCLINAEQPGEGWSDFCSLFFTAEATDAPGSPRTIAHYLQAEAPSGRGERRYPYSTNFFVNSLTYGDLAAARHAHDVGEIWASLLWEMYWKLVLAYGFDPDLRTGRGGNNVAMQLMVDGLKLQPCKPGFVDARDAILEADRLNNDGVNECRLWKAFAKRGLGYAADQGSSELRGDGIEDSSEPPACFAVRKLEIDVQPFRELNRIHARSHAPIPVAVLGSEIVDVAEIDPSLLAFGPEAAPAMQSGLWFERRREPLAWIIDLNRDGFDDLLTLFRSRDTGLADGDTRACLVGKLSGFHFKDCDAVEVKQPGRRHAFGRSR